MRQKCRLILLFTGPRHTKRHSKVLKTPHGLFCNGRALHTQNDQIILIIVESLKVYFRNRQHQPVEENGGQLHVALHPHPPLQWSQRGKANPRFTLVLERVLSTWCFASQYCCCSSLLGACCLQSGTWSFYKVLTSPACCHWLGATHLPKGCSS